MVVAVTTVAVTMSVRGDIRLAWLTTMRVVMAMMVMIVIRRRRIRQGRGMRVAVAVRVRMGMGVTALNDKLRYTQKRGDGRHTWW